MIQIYNEKLVELLIDELLIESVNMLNEIERKEKEAIQKQTRKALVNDYFSEFNELQRDQ